MFLKQIALFNFRNYRESEFQFDPAGNLIIGPNGCGKTNLLEAMAYCGIGKSIRFHRDDELLLYGTDQFSVKGGFTLDLGLDLRVLLSFQASRKLLKLDDIHVRQLSRLFECVKVIYCAPEDMNLVGGSPRFRRQYFDLAVSQLYPDYIPLLRNYLHLVEQRNSLLKREWSKPEKASWDRRFALALIEVVRHRLKYLELLNRGFGAQYQGISAKTRDLSVAYQSSQPLENQLDADRILEQIKHLEPRERKYQRSLIGAHLDDYEFLFAGRELKTYGSQGQKRIAVIVLKLIQAGLIEQITRIKPILLFDDIFAELDTEHTLRIRELVDYHYQVFIASPRADIIGVWNQLQQLKLPGVA